MLAPADPKHHRAAKPRANNQVRIARADNHHSVRAFEERQHLLHCFNEITIETVRDQLSNDLGIGVALASNAVFLQLSA